MKFLRLAIVSSAAIWLGTRYAQSFAFYNFEDRLTNDVRTVVDYGIVVFVPVTLFGVPWLVYRAWCHRRR